MNTIFIGIAGGTGSGKTTLTEHLAQRFGPDISVVHHDNYYKRQDCPFEERCKQNYDHPDAFDTELMVEDLKRLKAGETIHCPVYDYTIHNRTDKTIEIKPTKVVIVEGILIFQNKALRDLLDIKIFVETDADVRILRRGCCWRRCGWCSPVFSGGYPGGCGARCAWCWWRCCWRWGLS